MTRTEAILAGLAAVFIVVAGVFGDAEMHRVATAFGLCALGALVLLVREMGWIEA